MSYYFKKKYHDVSLSEAHKMLRAITISKDTMPFLRLCLLLGLYIPINSIFRASNSRKMTRKIGDKKTRKTTFSDDGISYPDLISQFVKDYDYMQRSELLTWIDRQSRPDKYAE